MFKFKNYKYDMIIIKLTNNDDYSAMQDYLHKEGLPWGGGGNNILKYNDGNECMHLYVHLNAVSLYYSTHYLIYSHSLDSGYISDHKYDPMIYTMSNLDKIKTIIEYGVIIPNYKPKKIERTL